jgi:dipeptidyl aminopeptidase/acylaminoacyl peptidase
MVFGMALLPPMGAKSSGRYWLLCRFDQAVQQLYTYDLVEGVLTRSSHPFGTYGFYSDIGVYFGSNEEIFAQWQDSTHLSQLIGLDSWTGRLTRTLLTTGYDLPGHPWRSVSFPSTGGRIIQGWLGLPDGAGPFPAILNTHGGPESLRTDIFFPQRFVEKST